MKTEQENTEKKKEKDKDSNSSLVKPLALLLTLILVYIGYSEMVDPIAETKYYRVILPLVKEYETTKVGEKEFLSYKILVYPKGEYSQPPDTLKNILFADGDFDTQWFKILFQNKNVDLGDCRLDYWKDGTIRIKPVKK